MSHMHILLPFNLLACHLTKGTLWRPLEAEQPAKMKLDLCLFHWLKIDEIVLILIGFYLVNQRNEYKTFHV